MPWGTLVGAGAAGAGMWFGLGWLAYKAYQNDAVRIGVDIAIGNLIPG